MAANPASQTGIADLHNTNGLLARLERESNEAAAAVLFSATEKAASIRESAEAETRAHRDIAVSERTTAHVAERESIRDRVSASVRAAQLQARAVAIDRIMVAVEDQSNHLMHHPSIIDLLRDDITSALRYLPVGPVTVWCRPILSDAAMHAAAQVDAARIAVSVDASMEVGIILQSADQCIEVNATIPAKLRSMRPQLEIQAAHLLNPAAS